MPWWGLVLVIVGCTGVGVFLGGCAMLLYVGRGMWG
jgi:hypothetical protein